MTTSAHNRFLSLALCSHPLPTLAMTFALTTGAALTGRSGVECLLVAATVLSGQLTIGWLNDIVDRHRDTLVGRNDKPVALGWVDPSTVWVAIACATVLVIPLSFLNGTYAGLAHLTVVACGWVYDLGAKKTALSWVPYAVAFGVLPAFLSYGGLGLGRHGSPPNLVITVLGALLGIGIHFLNALPDLAEDSRTGVHHLVQRVAMRTGERALFRASLVWTAAAAVGIAITGVTVGVGQ